MMNTNRNMFHIKYIKDINAIKEGQSEYFNINVLMIGRDLRKRDA